MNALLIDTKAAAERVALSVRMMEDLRLKGDGPPFAKIGRAVRYRVADLDAWVAGRLVTSTSDRVAA